MKYTAAFSILAFAATAIAIPTELEARTGGGGGGKGGGGSGGGGGKTCSASGKKQVCCNGLLNCVVQVASSNCNNSAYCCNTSAGTVRTSNSCYMRRATC